MEPSVEDMQRLAAIKANRRATEVFNQREFIRQFGDLPPTFGGHRRDVMNFRIAANERLRSITFDRPLLAAPAEDSQR